MRLPIVTICGMALEAVATVVTTTLSAAATIVAYAKSKVSVMSAAVNITPNSPTGVAWIGLLAYGLIKLLSVEVSHAHPLG